MHIPRYFVDLPEDRSPRRWDPHDGPLAERPDTRFFGAAFTEMEKTLRDANIDVVVTWDLERLPRYGDQVVAVVLGDEVGAVPRYLDRVRAVFKSYGTRPALGAGPLRNPGLTGVSELAQCAVRWLKWLPGGAVHTHLLLRRRLRREAAPAPVSVIPLGTFNQLDIAVTPIEARPIDVFFAGSIEHEESWGDRLSPKGRCRREMLAAVEQLRRGRPGLRLDIRVTSGFRASASAPAGEYSRALMNARVCLAPRGTSVETFRVLEGLRAGCVVIAERLPRHWFYDGAPLIQLDRWSALETLLPLDDPKELRRRHERALEWWRARCSEAAVGRFIAERLNGLAPRSGA